MQNNLQWLRTANRIHTSKKTFTGTSLTIQNTVNAPIERLIIDGASSQVGTPTPTAPITITNVVNPVLTVNSANIVQNGNFANGTTGWDGVATLTASNNELSILPTVIYGGARKIIPNYANYKNHKIYASADIQADTSEPYLLINDGVNQTLVNTNATGVYAKKSLIRTISTNATNLYIKLQDPRASGWTISKMKNVIAIDMGTDSTNPLYNLTTAQMDVLFANWSDYKSTATNLLGTLRNLPNGVKDKLVIDKSTQTAWIERNIGSVVLNGSESYIFDSENTTTIQFNRSFTLKNNGVVANDLICSHFINNIRATMDTVSIRNYNGAALVIRVSKSILTGYGFIDGNTSTYVTSLKTWLASNNVTVQYQLNTPTIESITYPSISTIQYLTNISKSGITSSISVDVLVMGN